MNSKYFVLFFLFIYSQEIQANQYDNDDTFYMYPSNNPPPELQFKANDNSSNSSRIQIQDGSTFMAIVATAVFLKDWIIGESTSKKEARLQRKKEQLIQKQKDAELLATIEDWDYAQFLSFFRLRDPFFCEEPNKDFLYDQAFCQIHFYKYRGFQSVLFRHPSFEEYVSQLQQKIKRDKNFSKSYGYKTGEFEAIVDEMVWDAEWLRNYNKGLAEKKIAEEQRQAEALKKAQEETRIRQQQETAAKKVADEQLKIKIKNQHIYQQQITAVMQEPSNDISPYCQAYENIDCKEIKH